MLHERQPLFVVQSDGSVKNKYYLKLLNKTDQPLHVKVTVESGPEGAVLVGAEHPLTANPGDITKHTVYAQVPRRQLKGESHPLILRITAEEDAELSSEYETQFFGPR